MIFTNRKGDMKDALIWAMILIFSTLIITVAGNYFYAEGKLDEQTQQELIQALENENKVEQKEESLITSLINKFGSNEDETSQSGGTLEEQLYAEQNEQSVDLESTYSTIKKAPTIIGVTIFGIPASNVFIGFIISCIVLILAYIGYQELKGFFGR